MTTGQAWFVALKKIAEDAMGERNSLKAEVAELLQVALAKLTGAR